MKEMVRQGDVRRPSEMPRISVRYQVNGIQLDWIAPKGGWLRPDKRKAVEAILLDLSVAGALIRAPENESVRVGMRIPIQLNGEDGIVEVRNIRKEDDAETFLYGVVFHRISEPLREAIYHAVARLRNDDRLKSDWNRGA